MAQSETRALREAKKVPTIMVAGSADRAGAGDKNADDTRGAVDCVSGGE